MDANMDPVMRDGEVLDASSCRVFGSPAHLAVESAQANQASSFPFFSLGM